jgi:hypothetical protein
MNGPFLTELDPRGAVKGSRDPLGIVPLWSQFGRHVVGNLTTVTGSVRGFTTTLLGYYFARAVQERDGRQAESTLALFLKFEQLAAYARFHAHRDDGFRGIERVKRSLAESPLVKLSARPEDQILSNQKVYGLWGLYSVAARASALLERDEAVLTARAREFVEREYLVRLTQDGVRDGRGVLELLRQPRAEINVAGRHAGLVRAIARLHAREYSQAERRFYHEHLVLGGPQDTTRGLQARLAELMRRLPGQTRFDRAQLRALVKEARRRGPVWEPLRDRLERIDLLEALLVPAAAAFGFLLARHGQRLADVAGELHREWGRLAFVDAQALLALRPEVAAAFHAPEAAERWARIAEALSAGEAETLLRLLVEHNAAVMAARGSSQAWVRLAHGRVDVRFRDEASSLPARAELAGLWWNNYFLDPLKEIVMTLAVE